MARKRTTAEIAAINADLRQRYGATMTRQNMLDYEQETGVFAVWIYRDPACKAGRGLYRIPSSTAAPAAPSRKFVLNQPAPLPEIPAPAPVRQQSVSVPVDSAATASLNASDLQGADIFTKMEAIKHQASLLASVPDKDPAFVPFGDFDMIRTTVASRKFFPILIVGLSGNGKTFGVNQACAIERREYIRVNITSETDEDDLIGGFRLVNGNTYFELGPVIVAMIRGAVLLIDEIDYASPKIACIQPVLEGKSITIKKLGITVSPTPGFTVFATANTKGRGDETGKFIGANLLNEAFLERFPITVEQEYPSVTVEKKILAKNFVAEGYTMTDESRVFFDTLAKWADSIRQTFSVGGIEDLISTRRLVHIAKAFGLFGYDQQKALSYCVNRFDPKVKDAFIDLYNKLAPDEAAPDSVGSLDGDEVQDPSF